MIAILTTLSGGGEGRSGSRHIPSVARSCSPGLPPRPAESPAGRPPRPGPRPRYHGGGRRVGGPRDSTETRAAGDHSARSGGVRGGDLANVNVWTGLDSPSRITLGLHEGNLPGTTPPREPCGAPPGRPRQAACGEVWEGLPGHGAGGCPPGVAQRSV